MYFKYSNLYSASFTSRGVDITCICISLLVTVAIVPIVLKLSLVLISALVGLIQ